MGRFNNYLQESINDKGIFKAVFLAGSPGSGKGYTLSRITSGAISPRVINTDKPYEFLVKTYGGIFSGQHDQFVDRAIQLTQAQLVQYLNSILPLVIDGTSNNPSSLLQRVGILESLGYDVGMVFIDTNLEVALSRAANRERFVPPEFIKQAHALVSKNKAYYKQKFGHAFYEIDNSAPVLDNSVIQSAYKHVSGFFNAPINNPTGIDIVTKMRKTGEKYLAPTIVPLDQITKKVSVWYAS